MNFTELYENEKICSFYKNNPNINITKVNLIFIDLFYKIDFNNSDEALYNNVTKILNNIPLLNKDIEADNHIKEVINIYENKSSEMFESIINGIDKHIYTNNLKNEIIENSSKKSILNILNKLYDNCEIIHLNHLKNDFIQNDNIDLFLINRLKKKIYYDL